MQTPYGLRKANSSIGGQARGDLNPNKQFSQRRKRTISNFDNTSENTKGDSNPKWLPVPDFPRYEVSDKGAIRNRKTGYRLKVRGGFRRSTYLTRKGRSYNVSITDLLHELFGIAPPIPVPKSEPSSRQSVRENLRQNLMEPPKPEELRFDAFQFERFRTI